MLDRLVSRHIPEVLVLFSRREGLAVASPEPDLRSSDLLMAVVEIGDGRSTSAPTDSSDFDIELQFFVTEDGDVVPAKSRCGS